MTQLSLVIPTIGQPCTTQDPLIQNAFTAIQNVINGSLDSGNLSAGAAQAAGMNQSGQVVKGLSIIATSEARTNTAFGTLPTPDQVQNLVVPANGLIEVSYQATWAESVAGAAIAAIFIGANQLKVANNTGNVALQQAAIGGTPGSAVPLHSSSTVGLTSPTSQVTGYSGDVTTGQMVGDLSTGGGPVRIFVAAGTYTISVQFKASSGTVTVSNRRLYAQVTSYA